jgi:hypothetical protein
MAVTMKNSVICDIKTHVRTSQETHYVSGTESSRSMLCKIWGFHGDDYEECRLVGCWAVWLSKNRRVGGIYCHHQQSDKNSELGTTLGVTSNRRTLRRNNMWSKVLSYLIQNPKGSEGSIKLAACSTSPHPATLRPDQKYCKGPNYFFWQVLFLGEGAS